MQINKWIVVFFFLRSAKQTERLRTESNKQLSQHGRLVYHTQTNVLSESEEYAKGNARRETSEQPENSAEATVHCVSF